VADGDTSVVVREPGIRAAERDPDALAEQIERTRAELARTIDSIADRVSPAKVTRRALDRARVQILRVDPKVAAATAAVAVQVVAFVIWRRHRRRSR
jgi:uncharacterized protein DUF3618